jgi:hypothetical protein
MPSPGRLTIVIVQNGAVRAVGEDALTAGAVDVVMAGQDGGAAAAGAAGAGGVDEATGGACRPAHADLVLGAAGGLAGVVAAADTLAPEEVVVARAVVHERALLGVVARGLVGDLVRRRGDRLGRAGHRRLVDVSPEGPKVHVVGRADGDQVRVDGIIGLGRGGRDSGGAVVGPGAVFESGRCCVAFALLLGIVAINLTVPLKLTDSRALRSKC